MESFDPLQFPKKLFLSGSDCFHRVLDLHAHKYGIGGNVMRQIFHFDEALSSSDIRRLLNRSALIYWLCNIELKPGVLLQAPYWKFIDHGNQCSLTVIDAAPEGTIPQSILDKDIPLHAAAFIEAHLIQYLSGKSAFILSWNHILLDAKGSALLIEHLENLFQGKQTDVMNFFPTKKKGPGLWKHIKNMYLVRDFIEESSRKPIATITTSNKRSSDSKSGFIRFMFTEHESKQIDERAFASGARFGPSTFYLACAAQAQLVLNENNEHVADLWLPVPYDGRMKGKSGPIIGNQVSVIFYRMPHKLLSSTPDLVKHLNHEMKTQIAGGIPAKYSQLLDMMGHIPLPLYYFLVQRGSKSGIASFLYTSTGEHFAEREFLFGKKITDMQIIPALTHPPGFTLLFLKQNGRLSVNIAYNSTLISSNRLLLFEERLRTVLLGLS